MVVSSAKIYELQADAKRSTALQPYKLQLLPFLEGTSKFHDVINRSQCLLPILHRRGMSVLVE